MLHGLKDFLGDLRYGTRVLVKSPGFTFIAILSLTLGIGANTAIFSLINAVLLRSLPVRNPHELRVLNWRGYKTTLATFNGSMKTVSGDGQESGAFPYPFYRDLRDQVEGCASVFAFANLWSQTVIGPDGAFPAEGLLVSGNYFDGYGVKTLLGRPIVPDDDRSEAEPVAVITYRWWERHGGLDPKILGRTITLGKTALTIVGVLPQDYRSPLLGDAPDFYVPLSQQPQLMDNYPLESRDHWWLQVMARLAPGANEARVQAAMEVFFNQTLATPGLKTKMDQPTIVLEDGSRGVLMERKTEAKPLWALLAAASVVLLIACANLASMLLARAATRGHEIAVRAAIGASRGRLIRQALTENLVLAFAGGAGGLLLAAWAQSAFPALIHPFDENFRIDFAIDNRVLAFTIGSVIFTALLFGLIPALSASRVDLVGGLQAAGRASTAPALRLGKALVSIQVGLSLLLIVGATLFVRTLVNLRQVDPGFRMENLLTFKLNLDQSGYKDDSRTAFYDRVIEGLRAIPGVREVGCSSYFLLGYGRSCNGISIPSRPANPDISLNSPDQLSVNETFFSTMGIPLLMGRTFTGADIRASARVAVVNQQFAQKIFNDENPIGRVFNVGSDIFTVIGVCADIKYDSLRNDVNPTMYFSFRQWSPKSLGFEVRSTLPPLSLAPAVRKVVAAIDANVPLTDIGTQQALFDRQIFTDKLLASLCATLALLATALSCIGLYGLMAYTVTRRTREIGIRMALGAQPKNVAWPVVREAILLATWGLLVGAPLALILTRILRSTLYGVEPYDPATLCGSAILLFAVAAISAWLPARRAAKVDPMTALRTE
jgi:predicted permease